MLKWFSSESVSVDMYFVLGESNGNSAEAGSFNFEW